MASLIGFKLSVFNPFCRQTHYHNTYSYLHFYTVLTYMLRVAGKSDANCTILVISPYSSY